MSIFYGTPWRTRYLGLALVAAAFLAACTGESATDANGPTEPLVEPPSLSIPGGGSGYDLNGDDAYAGPVDVNGAWWILAVDFKVGTGLINPFLTIQNSPWEWGFNTDAKQLPYDDKRPQFTNALPLNIIPVIQETLNGGPEGFREIILDANEANSDPDAQFSIDIFQLYLCADATAPDWVDFEDFELNGLCGKIYDIDPTPNVGPQERVFATDASTKGSGSNLDYRILIPNADFEAWGDISACSYNPEADPCGIYVILKTQMGEFGGDWVTGSTFEETSTIIRPWVEVTKTATPEFTREYTWSIEKSVDPTAINLFTGESQDADYTVTVSQDGVSDSGWMVSGTVTIHNPSDIDVSITSVTDELLPGGIPVGLSGCGAQTLASGATLECTYTHVFGSDPGDTEYTNTVSVELDGLSITGAASDPFQFTTPTTEVNKTVDVTDFFKAELTTLASGIDTGDIYTYSHTFTCDEDEGSHPNTAKVIGDGGAELDEASANVDVTCGGLTVEKDVTVDWDRSYIWTVEKTADPTSINLFTGESDDSDYTIDVVRLPDTDTYTAHGLITVGNSAAVDVTGVDITDCVQESTDGGTNWVDVQCENVATGVTIPAETSDNTFPYSIEFTPTADAMLRNHVLVVDGGPPAETVEPFVIPAEPTTETDATALVTDDWATPGDEGDDQTFPFGADGQAAYAITFTCDEDEGTRTNTVVIVGDDTGTEFDTDDATVTVACGGLTVEKDVTVDWERTYTWTVEKSVTPEAWDLFNGSTGTSKYTIDVTRETASDTYTASGTISVSNSASIDVSNVDVEDCVQESTDGGANWTDLTCETVATGETIAAGATVEYEYSIEFDPTADAMLRNHVDVSNGTAASTDEPFVLPDDPTEEFDATAMATDDLATADEADDVSWGFDGSGQVMYERTFSCSEDEGTTTNNVVLVGDDSGLDLDEDDATVTVACHDIEVTKDAETAWTRTWDWTIDKNIDPTHFLEGTYDEVFNVATINEGNILEVKYDITLGATAVASDWGVSGSIDISNPTPIDAEITDVADIITAGDIDGAPDCGVTFPTTILAGESLTCTYAADLPDGVNRTNAATATLQNYAYGFDGTPVQLGTTDYSGNADVLFSAEPTLEIDECVTVADVLSEGGVPVGDEIDVVPGTYCAGTGVPETFSVLRTFGGLEGIPVECGDNTFDNTATFTTVDTGTEGSDDATINIFVNCEEGCTLTQGYWKTHNESFAGGASKKADPTWELLDAPEYDGLVWIEGDLSFDGEGEPFYLSGQTWFEVFSTSPKGNAYYNLAHQYMAAVLNGLAGASQIDVAADLAAADVLFRQYTPGDIAALSGNDSVRQQFASLAGTLDDYNQGLIGPGHCTENDTGEEEEEE